ncbi:phage tail tape measure protein [Maribacter flavus]|uniref:Phage tail tape measure protein n=1 Tax=Maribacter flavus TaxID=1658664 RepID=A0A5B2TW97_9FLAO|nr:phage tail tape measure protein [Maribacter flavus]KAA2218238.1 phage tail tape measure protein [Maribacter flavus]
MAKRIVDEEMRFSIIVNGDRAQKELYDLEKSTRDLTQRNKELRQEKVRLFAQGKKESEEYKRITQEIKENNTVLKLNKVRMSELQKQIGITGLTMNQLKKRASELRLQFNNMVPGSAEYKRFQNDLKAVNAQLGILRTQGRTSKFGLSSLADGFNKYAALGASVIATVTGVIFSVQKLIDFNGKLSDAVADVQKTTGLTKKEVEDMAKSFGLLQTRTNRIDLLKIAEEGGRIGIAKEEIADFVAVMDKAVVALGDSFPGGVEETASKLGKLKLLFKETKDQSVDQAYNAIGSAINDLGAQGVATEINIANFATRVGSLPDALKPSISDALALGAAFEENGIQAEIAGRAYSILLTQAAEESAKFAEVMGITNKEVQDLINKNPLEFLIKFAKGLQGMNATDTANTLQYLGVSADGANKVLGALSNNTERFGQLMEISNRSMEEGTSLINEYNIKNNNFAATLDKLQKYFRGIFVNGPIVSGIKGIIMGLADLVGVADDLNEAFEKESKTIFENARANRNLANSSAELLEEYEALYKDGVIPTADEKLRLDGITLQLQNSLGDSVVAIDKETGALKLNTQAVRDQIKLKRLAADEEAATLASRLKGAQEEKERLERLLPEATSQANAADDSSRRAQRAFQQNNPGAFYDKETQEIIKLSVSKRTELYNLNRKIEEQDKRRLDLLKQLKELNYSESDIDLLFASETPTPPPTTTGTSTGGSGGGGFKVPTGGATGGAAARQKSLLDFTRATEDARLELLSDSYRKELEIQRVAHERKIQDLQSQKVTGIANATEINAEINKQIQIQEEINQLKIGTIIEKGLTERFTKYGEGYEKEKAQRLLWHNQELASLGNNEKAKEKLQEEFNAKELEREEAHLQELLRMLDEIQNSGYFEGINLELLSPEQLATFNSLADELILKLSEIGVAKSALGTGASPDEDQPSATEGTFGSADLFGFTPDQWEATFENLDTVEQKMNAALVVVAALSNAYGKFTEFTMRKNRAEFENFEKLQDRKRRMVEDNLNNGLINQRQHDEAVRSIEAETAQKKWELEYQQSKSDKVQGISNVLINTAVAIMQAYAQLGPIGGTIAAVLMGTLGQLQINAIRKTPLPAKGFEMGYYGNMPIQREQDGRVFNASYGGRPSTQLVDKPKYFLAGEGGKDFPEMIIDGKAFKQFNPEFKNSLYREIARVKGYESGYYQTQTKAPEFSDSSSTEERLMMMATLQRTNALLEKLDREGVQAYLKRSLQVAKDLREDIQDYENLRAKNRR